MAAHRTVTVDVTPELIESVMKVGFKSDRDKCVSGIPQDAMLRGVEIIPNGNVRFHFWTAPTDKWPEGSSQSVRPTFERVHEADGT